MNTKTVRAALGAMWLAALVGCGSVDAGSALDASGAAGGASIQGAAGNAAAGNAGGQAGVGGNSAAGSSGAAGASAAGTGGAGSGGAPGIGGVGGGVDGGAGAAGSGGSGAAGAAGQTDGGISPAWRTCIRGTRQGSVCSVQVSPANPKVRQNLQPIDPNAPAMYCNLCDTTSTGGSDLPCILDGVGVLCVSDCTLNGMKVCKPDGMSYVAP